MSKHVVPSSGRPVITGRSEQIEVAARPVRYQEATVLAGYREPDRMAGRRVRMPWASLVLYLTGQVALAVAIAFGTVGIVGGVIVCMTWLVLGAFLVGAQLITDGQ